MPRAENELFRKQWTDLVASPWPHRLASLSTGKDAGDRGRHGG
jgi:hypothetical protein